MTPNEWSPNSDGRQTRHWQIERDGHVFQASYDPRKDWVTVSAGTAHPTDPKGALGKSSGPDRIASILVSELIREGAFGSEDTTQE